MKYLRNYIEEAQTKLLNECGAFFAFSQSQFDEQKKAGVRYSALPHGLICEKEKVKTLIDGLESIGKKGIQDDIEENGIDNIIMRELSNHECYYTGSVEACVDALVDYNFETKRIKEVFMQQREKMYSGEIESEW